MADLSRVRVRVLDGMPHWFVLAAQSGDLKVEMLLNPAQLDELSASIVDARAESARLRASCPPPY